MDGGSPEGILVREGAALTSLAHIRAAASLCPGDMVEAKEWGTSRPDCHREQGGAAVGAITRLLARDNKVAISWVPAQQSIQANERADEIAKTTAEGRSPNDMVPDEYRWETSLS